MKKIGITGASGFIGKHFVLKFLEDGYEVVAYVRDPARVAFLTENPKLKIIQGDITDEKALEIFVKSVDAVVHLAAGTKGTWDQYKRATVDGTELLFKLAEKHHLKKLIVMSSTGDYDIINLHPHTSRGVGVNRNVVTEESPLETHPELRGDYAHSKILAEHFILEKMRSGTVATILLRAGLVYARNFKTPLMGCGIIRGGRGIILGFGRKRMPFVHIDDLYQAVKLALHSDEQTGIYNVVSETQPRIKDIVKLYNKYSPSPVKILFIPKFLFVFNHFLLKILPATNRLGRYNFLLCRTQKNIYYSSKKIEKELGWRATVSFEETMKAMVEYHESPVTVGVVGCGFAFKTLHLPVFRGNPRLKVRMIYDVNSALAAEAQKLFPEAEIPRALEEITKENYDLDFIVLLTPPHTHYTIAKMLLEQGYNLLIEKPLVLEAREALALQKMAEEKNIKVCVINNYRFRGNVQALLNAAQGEGAPDEIKVKFWSGPVIQSEGGWRGGMKNALVYEMAYHFLDIALLLGGSVKNFSHLEKTRDEKEMLVSLEATGKTEKNSRLGVDLRLFPPYSETFVEARYGDHAYLAGFYPETFMRLSGAVRNPVREIKTNVKTVLRYGLAKLKGGQGSSHAALYTLFVNALKDEHEEIPAPVAENIPLLELLDRLSQENKI